MPVFFMSLSSDFSVRCTLFTWNSWLILAFWPSSGFLALFWLSGLLLAFWPSSGFLAFFWLSGLPLARDLLVIAGLFVPVPCEWIYGFLSALLSRVDPVCALASVSFLPCGSSPFFIGYYWISFACTLASSMAIRIFTVIF